MTRRESDALPAQKVCVKLSLTVLSPRFRATVLLTQRERKKIKTVCYVLVCLYVTTLYRLVRPERRKLVTHVTKATIRLIKLPGEKISGNSAHNSAIVYADTKRKLSLTVNFRCATLFVPDLDVPKRVFGCLKKKKKKKGSAS